MHSFKDSIAFAGVGGEAVSKRIEAFYQKEPEFLGSLLSLCRLGDIVFAAAGCVWDGKGDNNETRHCLASRQMQKLAKKRENQKEH